MHIYTTAASWKLAGINNNRKLYTYLTVQVKIDGVTFWQLTTNTKEACWFSGRKSPLVDRQLVGITFT